MIVSERCECLAINCPEWYEREDFRAWLREHHEIPGGLATWYVGGDPDSGSDIFMYYDHGEISDAPPEEITELIREEWSENCNGKFGVVWLKNFN